MFSSLQRLCLILDHWSWLLWQAPSPSQKGGAGPRCWEVQHGMKLSLGVGSLAPVLIPHLTPVTHPSALGCGGEQHWDAEESSKSQVCVSVSSKTHLQLWFRPQGLASVGMSALWLWLSFSLPFPIFCAWMVVLLLSSSFYWEVGIQVKMQL